MATTERQPTEEDIQRACIELLSAAGYWVERNNTGVARGGRLRFGLGPGSPDLFVLGNGQVWAVEVKSATGKQRADQAAWQQRWEDHGGRYLLVRSAVDALRQIEGDQVRRNAAGANAVLDALAGKEVA